MNTLQLLSHRNTWARIRPGDLGQDKSLGKLEVTALSIFRLLGEGFLREDLTHPSRCQCTLEVASASMICSMEVGPRKVWCDNFSPCDREKLA